MKGWMADIKERTIGIVGTCASVSLKKVDDSNILNNEFI